MSSPVLNLPVYPSAKTSGGPGHYLDLRKISSFCNSSTPSCIILPNSGDTVVVFAEYINKAFAIRHIGGNIVSGCSVIPSMFGLIPPKAESPSKKRKQSAAESPSSDDGDDDEDDDDRNVLRRMLG